MNEPISIAHSKAKLIKLLIFCLLFIAGGLWIIIADPHSGNAVFDNSIVKDIAAYGAVIMGLFGLYFFTIKLLDKKPGLIIDEEGIYDNTSAFNFGLIPWGDISSVYERSVQASATSKQHFVTIGLFDADKYISKEKNLIKRKIIQANANGYGSPVHISANGLQISHQELFQLVLDAFERSRK